RFPAQEALPLHRQVDQHQAREGEGAAPLREGRHARAGMAVGLGPVRPLQGQRRRDLPAPRRVLTPRGAMHRAASRWTGPWVAVAALAPLAPAAAQADPPGPKPAQRTGYSPYEQQTLERALAELKGVIDPKPEGKILEGVEIVRLDVFEDRDPLP